MQEKAAVKDVITACVV